MRRREFIKLVCGSAAAWPLGARAQRSPIQNRIAIFHPAIPTTHLNETGGGSAWPAFFAELRRLGHVEGENLIIERYSAEGHHERYAGLAREIVARNPAEFGRSRSVLTLLDAIESRQRALEKEAREIGRMLYAERPRAWLARIRNEWDAWRE